MFEKLGKNYVVSSTLTNGELLVLVNESLNGSKDSQLRLMNECKLMAYPIALKYRRNGFKIGLSLQDLEDFVNIAFFEAVRRYDSTLMSFEDYFKFCYLRAVQNEFKKQVKITNRLFTLSTQDNDKEYISNNLPSSENIINKILEKEIIFRILLNEKAQLNEEEKEDLLAFLHGFKIKEISSLSSRKYSEVRYNIKKALIKIKNYMQIIAPEIKHFEKNKQYNESFIANYNLEY